MKKFSDKLFSGVYTRRKFAVLVMAFIVAGLTGCENRSSDSAASVESQRATVVYTVNYPLAYFAERIGGDWVEVRFPAPAGVDPATWQPAPEIVLAYQEAALVLTNGAGYAQWLKTASLPAEIAVDTSAAIAGQLIETDSEIRHKHGPEGEHSHRDVAATTWLDPRVAIQQAEAVRLALAAVIPAGAADFAQEFASLEDDLFALDLSAEQQFATMVDTQFVFTRPVYQYLQRRFDLVGSAVNWPPDQQLSEAQLEELAGASRLDNGVIVWDAPVLAENRAALEAIGYRSIVLPTLANKPPDGDYLSEMAASFAQLQQAVVADD